MIILLLISQLFSIVFTQEECGTVDWKAYQDEFCYKLINEVVTWDEAKQLCTNEGSQGDDVPHLVYIKNVGEQEFITNYIFEEVGILDTVWLGAERNGFFFKWLDGVQFTYSNWDIGMPIADLESVAVQMNPGSGSWENVPKGKRNVVLCQKLQTWSLQKLAQSVLKLQKNPVPLGFVYVQLPNEPSPLSIWPELEWTDISPQYADLFFRVLGPNSASFGVIQADKTRQITRVAVDVSPGMPSYNSSIYETGWSSVVSFEQSEPLVRHYRQQFYTAPTEVRPRNTAVKIWKRLD